MKRCHDCQEASQEYWPLPSMISYFVLNEEKNPSEQSEFLLPYQTTTSRATGDGGNLSSAFDFELHVLIYSQGARHRVLGGSAALDIRHSLRRSHLLFSLLCRSRASTSPRTPFQAGILPHVFFTLVLSWRSSTCSLPQLLGFVKVLAPLLGGSASSSKHLL